MNKPKKERLFPLKNTLRELYLKSGNQCAFPDCQHLMMDNDGVFVGQICHIEAAEKGGERFNKDLPPEDRRKISNLLLLCYGHHQITNDVTKYPVNKMVEMKLSHELKFSNVAEKMEARIIDHTRSATISYAKTLKGFVNVLNWTISKTDLKECVEETATIATRCANLPLPIRTLFEILISRSKKGSHGADLQISFAELRFATGQTGRDLKEIISVLDDHKFAFAIEKDEPNDEQQIGVYTAESNWTFWSDVKLFCKKKNIPVARIVNELDFSVLD